MHLSAKNNEVQGYVDCSSTDNGFDRLWVAGGYSSKSFYNDATMKMSATVSSFSVSPNKSSLHMISSEGGIEDVL